MQRSVINPQRPIGHYLVPPEGWELASCAAITEAMNPTLTSRVGLELRKLAGKAGHTVGLQHMPASSGGSAAMNACYNGEDAETAIF